MLVALGVFTVSWEQLGNLPLGPYNVKLPALLFSVAAVLSAPRWIAVIRSIRSRPTAVRWVAVIAAAVLVVFAVRAVTSFPIGLGLAQLAAVGSGALLPALAIVGTVRSSQDVVWVLRWFIGGALVAGVFGLYQLIAFYLGLPQGISYTGVGTSGEGGRISAFSYEPAYFAYFLMLALGAVVTKARLQSRRVGWPVLVFFAIVLTLANVRALLFLLPVVAVLLAVSWGRNRGLLLRSASVAVIVIGLNTVIPLAVTSAVATHAQEAPSPSPSRDPSPEEQSPSVPSTVDPVVPPQLPTDVLDPNERSSNGPRLDLYRAVLAVDLEAPLVGVGPGHLRDALADNGYVAPNQGANVVANNIWLQAGADGGVPLLLLEMALVASMTVLWWRARRSATHALLCAWLGVVLVGGMLTSYLFDIKIWVIGAVALIAFVADLGAQRTPASA